MVQFEEKDILPAGLRHHSARGAIAKGAARGDNPARQLQEKHEKGIVQIGHQQAGDGKNTGADHIGNDNIGNRKEAELSL
ncbi:hypothetical protein GF407_02655 [candidate division KSB1 bacterium]|nr:hypothetical protein [candidate division KSB1 bacterium]